MKKTLKIPNDRVAVLIGENGRTKESIEEKAKVKLYIKDNSVMVEGESLNVWKTKDVIKAVGRGFNPQKALKILNHYNLEVLDLSEYCSTKKSIQRIKSRIIGKKGEARNFIENNADVFISVYGKTVSIIGEEGGMERARKAIMMLISGSPHNKVYNFLK